MNSNNFGRIDLGSGDNTVIVAIRHERVGEPAILTVREAQGLIAALTKIVADLQPVAEEPEVRVRTRTRVRS